MIMTILIVCLELSQQQRSLDSLLSGVIPHLLAKTIGSTDDFLAMHIGAMLI